jgi:hypothetical protein
MTPVLGTPFGWPVTWADIRVTGDVSDDDARQDQRCMVVSVRRLGSAAPGPLEDFILCVVAAGGTATSVGWHASRLAQAVFLEAFLASADADVLWRLRDAVRAADARLASSPDGPLVCTLTALFVAGDGTAYGVSVGDSPLLVIPRRQDERTHRRVQQLGHEHATALGTGETGPAQSGAGAEGVIEQWWPGLEGDGTRTRLAPGTSLLLGSGRLRAGLTAAMEHGNGIAMAMERGSGVAIAVRFDGGQVLTSRLVAHAGWLVAVVGYDHAGAAADASGTFGLACLAADHALARVPGLLRSVLEVAPSDMARCAEAGLEENVGVGGDESKQARVAVVVSRAGGGSARFASGGASVDQAGEHVSVLRLGSDSDPLDRGVRIEFQPAVAAAPVGPGLRERRGARLGRWRVVRLWRTWRGH